MSSVKASDAHMLKEGARVLSRALPPTLLHRRLLKRVQVRRVRLLLQLFVGRLLGRRSTTSTRALVLTRSRRLLFRDLRLA